MSLCKWGRHIGEQYVSWRLTSLIYRLFHSVSVSTYMPTSAALDRRKECLLLLLTVESFMVIRRPVPRSNAIGCGFVCRKFKHPEKQTECSPSCIQVRNSSSSLWNSPGEALYTGERSVAIWCPVLKISGQLHKFSILLCISLNEEKVYLRDYILLVPRSSVDNTLFPINISSYVYVG